MHAVLDAPCNLHTLPIQAASRGTQELCAQLLGRRLKLGATAQTATACGGLKKWCVCSGASLRMLALSVRSGPAKHARLQCRNERVKEARDQQRGLMDLVEKVERGVCVQFLK